MELCIEFAAEHRRPVKVLVDLMGVETKTLYRWLAETSTMACRSTSSNTCSWPR